MVMSFSWVRSLTATVRLELSGLKRDAKRLQRATPEVLGQSFALSQCQEAVARMRGFQTWHEAVRRAIRAGADKKSPPWFFDGRNDLHEAVVQALGVAEIETREDAGCVFTGTLTDSVAPALALWAEEVKWRKVPGLIAIDTEKATLQDTSVWQAAEALDLADVLQACRVIDTRADRCAVSLSATVRDWVAALGFALPTEQREVFENCGLRHSLEVVANGFAKARNGGNGDDENAVLVSYAIVSTALSFVCHGSDVLPSQISELEDEAAHGSIQHTVTKYLVDAKKSPDGQQVLKSLWNIDRRLDQKQFDLGVVLAAESRWRPTVVLFDAGDAASSILAASVHALYFWRYVGWQLRHAGIEPRPTLYVNDAGTGDVAPWLRGFSSRTCIVPGPARGDAWSAHLARSAFQVQCSDGAVAFAGKRVRFSDQLQTNQSADRRVGGASGGAEASAATS